MAKTIAEQKAALDKRIKADEIKKRIAKDKAELARLSGKVKNERR